MPPLSPQFNCIFLYSGRCNYFVHYSVASVILSRGPGRQIETDLCWGPRKCAHVGVYVGWDKRRVQSVPGQPAGRFPRRRPWRGQRQAGGLLRGVGVGRNVRKWLKKPHIFLSSQGCVPTSPLAAVTRQRWHTRHKGIGDCGGNG